MTFHLSFYQKELLVIRFSLCASSFYDKLCARVTDEELDAVTTKDEETGDDVFMNKAFIKEMWGACLEYEYISINYDFMGFFVDKMILKRIPCKVTFKSE